VTPATHTYWAFLCYSSLDRSSALWLQRALEAYVVPQHLVGKPTPAGTAPTHFRPIFRDDTELSADPDLVASIEGALSQSAHLIVVCSPRAAQSNWVNREIERFRDMHGDARILCVIVDGNPANPDEDCFPPALRYRIAADGRREPVEPSAADLRAGRDGRRLALLKLVGGMLGVGLDDLIRRDTQRRQRKLLLITAASVAGMAVTGALATAAWIARNEAQNQRAHAEGLIEFMLTDLRKRLEPAGHLDQMDVVGRQALQYYVSQNPAHLDAESLARRARALRLMGEISMQRGDLEDALTSFKQASATTSEVLDRAPDDGNGIFNHAQNVFWVGEIARQRGDSDAAEASFREYRRLAERLNHLDPDKMEWQAETAYAESALGVLFLEKGRMSEAITAFEHSLAVDGLLADRKPDDLGLQVQLGQGHAWLADALLKQGHLAAARTHEEVELAIYKRALIEDPTLHQAKFSAIVADQMLGRIALLEGRLPDALAAFKDTSERAEALLVEERDNMDLTATVAYAHVQRGEALLDAGDLDSARNAQHRAVDLLTIALAHDGNVVTWRNWRDQATLLQAAIDSRTNAHAEALHLVQSVQASLQSRPAGGSFTDATILLQRSRLQAGIEFAALGRDDEARAQWNDIIASVPPAPQASSPLLVSVLAAAHRRLGHEEDAETLTKYLADLSRESADAPPIASR
jgi:tetratricopeptide (TPR) repeat protein